MILKRNLNLFYAMWVYATLAFLLSEHACAEVAGCDEGDVSCLNNGGEGVHDTENSQFDFEDSEVDEEDSDDEDESDEYDSDDDDDDEEEEDGEEEEEWEAKSREKQYNKRVPWATEQQELKGRERIGVMDIVQQTNIYMTRVISQPEYDDVRNDCLLQHSLCSYWAAMGELKSMRKEMNSFWKGLTLIIRIFYSSLSRIRRVPK